MKVEFTIKVSARAKCSVCPALIDSENPTVLIYCDHAYVLCLSCSNSDMSIIDILREAHRRSAA